MSISKCDDLNNLSIHTTHTHIHRQSSKLTPKLNAMSDHECLKPRRREARIKDERFISRSTENLFQNFQYYIRRQNENFFRNLSTQTSNVSNDLDTFKKWAYQDLKIHRQQLKEAGSSLFFRNGTKHDMGSYDIVITFTEKCDDDIINEFKDILRLRHPAICVEHKKHYFVNNTENVLYVTGDNNFFIQHMEEFSGDKSESNIESTECFEPKYYPDLLKCSSWQRQSILFTVLNEWFYETGQYELNDGQCVQFPNLSKYISPGDLVLNKLIASKIIGQIFPLHHEDDLTLLKSSWVTKFFASQPLDKICEYFGFKIALYFAFIGFYTRYLLYPTFFGIFLTYFSEIVQLFDSLTFGCLSAFVWFNPNKFDCLNDILLFIFTIFNMFWSTFLLQEWHLKCRAYTTQWIHYLPQKVRQFKYTPDIIRNNVASNLGTNFRGMIFKYCVTFPIIGSSLGITFTVMFYIFNFQVWWDSEIIENQQYPAWTHFVPKILLASILYFNNYIYYLIAIWLNNKEIYNNFESKENNLILKLVLFQFLNSFLPLFYIAFYLNDVDKLQEQLAAQLITRQVIGNFNEAVWPFIKESYRLTTRKFQIVNSFDNVPDGDREDSQHKLKRLLTKSELESCMYRYESTFDDYLELVFQFGYVMLFAPVFPLAALCAFLNNLIEIRSDAFKFTIVYQRPFGYEHVSSIGEWANVLHYLSIAAIATNCALMVVTGQISRVFRLEQSTHIIVVGVAIEHTLMLLKWLIPIFHPV